MPNPITATYQDPQLAPIRQMVANRTAKLPYVLLPIRMETRFMQVPDLPAPNLDWGFRFFEEYALLHDLLLETAYKPGLPVLQKTLAQAKVLTTVLAEKKTLSGQEKLLLNQAMQQWQTDKAVLKANVVKSTTTGGTGIISNRITGIIDRRRLTIASAETSQYKELLKTLDNIEAGVKSIKPQPGSSIKEMDVLLENLNTLAAETARWTSDKRKIPFTDVKNKKALYTYLNQNLEKAATLVATFASTSATIRSISKNQRERSDSLVKAIVANLRKAPAAIKSLHRDKNFQQFLKKEFAPLATKTAKAVLTAGTRFQTRTKKIIGNPEPQAENLQLYLSGIKTVMQVKRFNLQTAKGYATLSTFQQQLKKNMEGLTAKLATVKSQPQLNVKMAPILQQLSVQVNAATAKANNFAVANKSQAFGKQKLTSYQEKLVGSTLPKLLQQQPKPVERAPVVTPLKRQLWVRIYPDDIFVKTHEPALFSEEIKAGKTFWKYWWCASGDRDLELAAWTILCSVLGAPRAAWVAKSLDPRLLRANQNMLGVKPSGQVLSVLQYSGQAVTHLNTIKPDGAITTWLASAVTIQAMQNALQHFTKMAGILPLIKQEQVSLGERFRVNIIQAASVMELVLGKVHATDAATLQNPALANGLALLQQLTSQFTAIQQAFNKVNWVTERAFADEQPDFPAFPSVPEKDAAWTKAPHTDCLPNRFVVLAKRGGQFIHIKVGKVLPPEVQLGLNPDTFTDTSSFGLDADGNLKIDPGMEWMVNYAKAENIGLGITIDVSADDYDKGFEQVMVLGLSDKNETDSAATFEALMENHLYSPDGMALLKIGTPTNNTADEASGYGSENDETAWFDYIVGKKGLDPTSGNLDKPDGAYLSEALSLSANLVAGMPGSNGRQLSGARAMNKILWPATLGHAMEEMWDQFFPYDNIRRAEQFFDQFVSGRGHLPALRIGTQPYGLLVTTAWSRFAPTPGVPALSVAEASAIRPWGVANVALEAKLQQRFDARLWTLLQLLNQTWTGLRNQHVVHAGNLKVNGSDDELRFMNMLGLHAHSLAWFYRYGVNIAVGMEGAGPGFDTQFQAEDEFGPNSVYEKIKDLAAQGVYSPGYKFNDEDAAYIAATQGYKLEDSRFSRIYRQVESSRLFAARLGDDNLVLQPNLVQDGNDSNTLLPPLEGQANNYIGWLLQQSLSGVLGGNDFDNPSRIPDQSLLFYLLRQGLLQANQKVALDLLQMENLLEEPTRRTTGSKDKYLSLIWNGSEYQRVYTTKWHFLFKDLHDLVEDFRLPGTVVANPFYTYINGSVTSMARYLDRVKNNSVSVFQPAHLQHFNQLKTYREALQYLQRYTVKELELLMAEHMDLCSYRLDAWQQAFAARRLQQQRSKTPTGIFFGAFGYVENLVADKNKTLTKANLNGFKLPAGSKVYQDPDNQGFIHGPSISHAVTAAVLRNAYINNREEGDVENRLAVNLSSSRIRMALRLMEGIRNGQETGAVLGFQFERGLHERFATVELDKYIQPFRKAFPLQQPVSETAPGTTAPYVSVVADGMAMLDAVYASINWIDPATNASKDKTVAALLKESNYAKLPAAIKAAIDSELKPADNKHLVYNNIIDEIDRMADAFDALGDVALSESVYQMVAGNHVRAGAVLDAMAEGRLLPDAEVIKTPRTGHVVSHRVMLNLETKTSASLPAGWTFNGSIKAMTEPSLNFWLGETLGLPAQYHYVIRVKDNPDAPVVLVNKTLADADVHLQPIDIFTLPGKTEELLQTLVGLYRIAAQDFQSIMTIHAAEIPAGAPNARSLNDMQKVLGYISGMLSNARTAGASDFVLASDNTDFANAGQFDLANLEARIQAAFGSLGLFIQQLEAETYISQVLDGSIAMEEMALSNATLLDILQHLEEALSLGFPNAMHLPVDNGQTESDNALSCLRLLFTQLKEAKKRKGTAAKAMAALPPASNQRLRTEKLIEAAALILGRQVRVLPSFTKPDISGINTQLGLLPAQKITRHNGPLAVEDWLQQIAPVRPRMTDLHQYRRLADAFDMPEVTMQPAQVPYAAGDFWLGGAYPSNFVPAGDYTSLFMLNEAVLGNAVQCGLIIDEWHEIIPGKEETTAISFHYNQPGATAPQSVLVAVAPAADEKWNWDDLVYTISDTIEMAKNRAVEPDHLEKSWLTQVLPSIYAEVVPPQMRDEPGNPLGVQAVMDFANVKTKAE